MVLGELLSFAFECSSRDLSCDLTWEVGSVVKGEGVASLRLSNRRGGQFCVNISSGRVELEGEGDNP